jgi:hypothetical protein
MSEAEGATGSAEAEVSVASFGGLDFGGVCSTRRRFSVAVSVETLSRFRFEGSLAANKATGSATCLPSETLPRLSLYEVGLRFRPENEMSPRSMRSLNEENEIVSWFHLPVSLNR